MTKSQNDPKRSERSEAKRWLSLHFHFNFNFTSLQLHFTFTETHSLNYWRSLIETHCLRTVRCKSLTSTSTSLSHFQLPTLPTAEMHSLTRIHFTPLHFYWSLLTHIHCHGHTFLVLYSAKLQLLNFSTSQLHFHFHFPWSALTHLHFTPLHVYWN